MSSLTADEGSALELSRFIRLEDSGKEKAANNNAALTVYLAARVGSLISVALFGCTLIIGENGG